MAGQQILRTTALAVLLVLPLSVARTAPLGEHEGIATCSGSACHSRAVSSGAVVRQNEVVTWQDASSAAGAHSRAWRVLTEPRGQAIASRMGLGPAEEASACLGCHTEVAEQVGPKFQISDGVGCEACHGGAGAWLPSHYAVGATHAANIAQGMTALEDPKTRAAVCLDCHWGSTKPNQFVSHRMMAAGHPRLTFELDLFSTLQRHYDIDDDYAKRKSVAGGIKIWSIGQAMALESALTLYLNKDGGQQGPFPELIFFDCRSCHRPIYDTQNATITAQPNPARPIPIGTPPFNDENMIMLSAAARVVAPDIADKFEVDSRDFHAALVQDRATALAAAQTLSNSADALGSAFAARAFSRADTFAILDTLLEGAVTARYTDYTGGAQAVMGIDTLLNSLVAAGQVPVAAAEEIRPDINILYVVVRDANSWRPAEFRSAVQRVATAIRSLR